MVQCIQYMSICSQRRFAYSVHDVALIAYSVHDVPLIAYSVYDVALISSK